MITIPRLTEKDLEVFKGKKLLLYGDGFPLGLYQTLKLLDIDVLACYAEKPVSKKIRAYAIMRGVRCINKRQLQNLIRKHNNIVVQIASAEAVQLVRLQSNVRQWGLEDSGISSGKIMTSFSYRSNAEDLRTALPYWNRYKEWKGISFLKTTDIPRPTQKHPIIICSPPKTADHSMNHTFDALNVEYFNVFHAPKRIDKKLCEKQFGTLKILMGVREPISQNVSTFYEHISGAGWNYFAPLVFLRLQNDPSLKKQEVIDDYQHFFETHSHDAQALWNATLSVYMDLPIEEHPKKGMQHYHFIQRFIPLFQSQILDILAYPFDKENGYTIIKEGNTEVFIYQLEKLNSLVPKLSEWVGVPFDRIEIGNQASDKWIAESYKQAQKELEITQEYFDKCFSEPYVKHCYSEADIEKFQERWRPHIKK